MEKLSKIGLVLAILAVGVVSDGAFQALGQSATSTTSTETATGLSVPTAIDPVNPAAVPLGDGNVSTYPKIGYVNSCQTTFNGQGAKADGPWINTAAKTWNSETKLSVEGSVSWPSAQFQITVSGDSRTITGNDEPIDHTTGTFPIAKSDPAYQYDSNPNHIAAQNLHFVLPVDPVLQSMPSCVGLGAVGVLLDGVYLYNALDAEGRDAGAHEVLDSSQGHPDSSDTYHHHEVPSFMVDNATTPDSATLVGYAADGFGIYVERDASGNLLTNDNLDACHGRTSVVPWDGQLVDMYHYDATLEYPYTIGCFMGSTTNSGPTMSMSSSTSSTQPPPVTTTSTSTTATSTTSGTSTLISTTTSTSLQTFPTTTSTVLSSTTTSTLVSSTTVANNSSAVQAAEFPFAALPLVFCVLVLAVALMSRRRQS